MDSPIRLIHTFEFIRPISKLRITSATREGGVQGDEFGGLASLALRVILYSYTNGPCGGKLLGTWQI
ncbi:hypothetical protein Tco_1336412 [Tanacetum coccineum]